MEKGKLLSQEELKRLKEGDKVIVFTRTYGSLEAKITEAKNEYIIVVTRCNNGMINWKISREHYNSVDNMKTPIEIYSYQKSKQYTGIEILQMIKDGQLKEGAELLGYMPDGIQDGIMRIRDSGNGRLYIENVGDRDTDAWDLINMTFSIKEKEYISFDEARRSGKRFKFKGWEIYCDLKDVLIMMIGCSNDIIQELLNNKVWEVEN